MDSFRDIAPSPGKLPTWDKSSVHSDEIFLTSNGIRGCPQLRSYSHSVNYVYAL